MRCWGFIHATDGAGMPGVFLQFAQHFALKTPCTLRTEDVFELPAFGKIDSLQRLMCGEPFIAALFRGKVGIALAAVPVVHEKCMGMAVLKIKGAGDYLMKFMERG